MSEPDETVADVLEDYDDDHCIEMRSHLKHGAPTAEEMGYEDWVRPLKLTGGRVCLRVEWGDSTGFVAWRPTGLVVEFYSGLRVGPPNSVTWTKGAIRLTAGPVTIVPVLREDTPFAEAE